MVFIVRFRVWAGAMFVVPLLTGIFGRNPSCARKIFVFEFKSRTHGDSGTIG